MHATTAVQTPPPKTLTGSSPKAGDSSQNGGASSTPSKTKKRERNDNANEASKRERSLNPEEIETTATSAKNDHAMEEFEKDGLTSVASVEKLVVAMQQDRNDGSRKPSEFASRRTGLAAAMSATENNECLERFVQLGGVALFHEWLQEAYKGRCGDGESPKDGGNKGMEELLLTILSALEKLPVDLQALRCQVGKSVNNLKSHRNVEIKEKARKLVETWKKRVGDEMNLPTGSKSGGSQWSTNMKNLPLNVSGTDMAGLQTSNGSPVPLLKPSEKGSTNLPPNNGQLWSSNATGAITWKEDVKSPSSGSKIAHRNSQGGKGLNAASNKESTTAKPLAWSRNLAEKAETATLESGTKPVTRLPRSASAGVNEEVFGPASQGSSPSLPDQAAPSSIADAPDTKQKLPLPVTKYAMPPELSADQQQDDNGTIKPETEKQSVADAVITSEVSRTSDSNDRGVSMAIVPVSAISRISGSERNVGVGASGRSTVLSEAGTIDQEAPAHGSADTGVPSPCKDEGRRKETQDGGDGANCASSSSFTEMSVAGQGANTEQKSELSSATMEGEEGLRPVEGLGESPEPRPSTRRGSAEGDTLQDKKLPADVSSTQGSQAPFGRTSFDGLGRRLERYDNSWDEKRSSYFFGQDGRKLSSEAESRKHGAELDRSKSAEFKEIKRADSTSEFAEDDALEVAQQIAKEVEQEVETSHLSSTKDDRDHLSTREPDASPGHLMEKCSVPLQKLDSVQIVGDVQPMEADRERKEEIQEPVESTNTPTHNQDEPASSARVEEDKRAENVVSRPDFDLNEGLGGDETLKEVSCAPVINVVASVAGPTTPIAVLPTTRGAFIPPEPPAKTKSEPGWRGSAATSAFRPAEPRRIQELQQQHTGENKESSTGRQARPPLDIDLNVADTETMFESQSLFVKPKQALSTLGRVDFDLNFSDECEDAVELEMKVESTGLGRKDAQGTTTLDFDLNGPVEEEPTVQHVSLRNSSETTSMVGPSVGFRGAGGGTGVSAGGDLAGVAPWFPSANSFSAVAIPAFPMARADTSYPVQAQPYLNAGAGPIHFDLYRGGMTLATPAVAYPGNPPVPYPYAAAGFPFASNFTGYNSASFPASFAEPPAGSGSYPAPVSSQIGGPGAMSRYIRPHLMGIPETAARADNNASAWARPSLDLNTGPDAGDDLRPQQNGGPRTVALEDHLRGFGQVAQAGKRKEPESGWEVFQAGQPAWC